MPEGIGYPAEWGIMTDRERAAWTKAHTSAEAAPAKKSGRSAEDIVSDMQKGERSSYLRPRNQSTDHMN